MLRGLALAGQARATDSDECAGLLAELDQVTQWLAARAADAPDNFLHLLRLFEAERAWADGDFRAAVLAYDAARQEAAQRQRPRHRALIAERAARFFLAHGAAHVGYDLLAQARQQYAAWGATAKVGQLDWAYPVLRLPVGATAGVGPGLPGDVLHKWAAVTTGTIGLLGVRSASQTPSSETSIGRLHSRVTQVLSAMTGATGVHLLLWSEERQGWLLPTPGGGTAPVSGTGREHHVPMSVLRSAQRTHGPLVAVDATRDDRFASDPYFAHVTCCSLLAVPILSRGMLRAVLLLENRLLRGAFTTERPDASSVSPASSPSPWTTPSCTPSSPPPARGSSRPPTRRAAGSSRTCTTALNSRWLRWRRGCAPLGRCRPSSARNSTAPPPWRPAR